MTAKLQVSGKLPDGRIYVIGGDTADELFDNLSGVLGDGEAAQKVFQDFTVLLDPPSVPQSSPAARSGPAAGPPAPGAPSCQHGTRYRKEGFMSKAGKQMPSSWQCPSLDRASQCKALWNDA